MKKYFVTIISVLVAAVLLTSTMFIASAQSGDVNIITKTKTIQANKGDKITYAFAVKCPEKVINGQFAIKYPSAILKTTDKNVGKNTAIKDFAYNTQAENTNGGKEIRFNFTDPVNGYNFSKQTRLITITFEVIAYEGSGNITTVCEEMCNANCEDVAKKATFAEQIKNKSGTQETTVEPTTKPVEPTINITEPQVTTKPSETDKPTEPVTESVTEKPSETVEPTEPTTKITEVTEPATEATEPATKATEPVTETVEPVAKTIIDLPVTKKTLYVGKTYTIESEIQNATGTTLYTSKNKAVATVTKNGKVTAKAAGKTTIIIKHNDATAAFTVTVKNPYLTKTKVNLKKNKTYTIKIKGKVGTPTFKTNKKSVATVSKKGKVTAKKHGKATITVTTNGGIKLKLKVTVKK